jgi:hypothetical protein
MNIEVHAHNCLNKVGKKQKEVRRLRRLLWTNLVLGIWLMLSPFVLRFFYQGVFKITWEDFILGFAIALISFGRLFSHTSEEILITDWIVTVAAVLTFINPLLYNYYGITSATMNNLLIGGLVFLFSIYVDWKDSHRPS